MGKAEWCSIEIIRVKHADLLDVIRRIFDIRAANQLFEDVRIARWS